MTDFFKFIVYNNSLDKDLDQEIKDKKPKVNFMDRGGGRIRGLKF